MRLYKLHYSLFYSQLKNNYYCVLISTCRAMDSKTVNLTDILSRFINSTNQHIFLTGKAGTGKTTFLRDIAKTTHKNIVIAAPTGIAAINARGVTLHSLFQLPFGTFIPDNNDIDTLHATSMAINTPSSLFKGFQMHKNKRKVLQQMELLVIDEVSMLRADLLDAIDLILKSVRRERRFPFGGVQVLFIGDLLQLPPVVKDEEWMYLSKYYDSPYFFSAQVLKESPLVYVELEKIYRQSDTRFINLLNNLRNNAITNQDIDLLNEFYQPDYKQKTDDGVILLTTHNYIADERNTITLAKLKKPEKVFDAVVTGEFSEYNYPVETHLKLKEGAQVMFIKNDYTGNQRYFNGKVGHVESFGEDGIVVGFNDGSDAVMVDPYTWENKKYTINKENNEIEEKIAGTFKQYPLKLAWAITVHKSQGLTFDKAIIDVNKAFVSGQSYVALSRLRDINGLILTSKIPEQGIPISNSLKEFSQRKKKKEELLPILKMTSDLYLQNYCMQAYDFSNLEIELRRHLESYNKDGNRSEKQQHRVWASKLYDDSQEIKKVADSFKNQIHKILYAKADDYLNILDKRMEKSINYFEPLIKGLHQQVIDKIDELKQVKGVKSYLTELEDLANLYQDSLKYIYKARSLLQVTITGDTLDKSAIEKPELSKPKETESIRKSKGKIVKIPTHQISYGLFKQGKTISEIAQERSLLKSTIEVHLTKCIATGELSIEELMSSKKRKVIEKKVKEIGDLALTPIKEALGSDYSYSEIKMVLVHMKLRK